MDSLMVVLLYTPMGISILINIGFIVLFSLKNKNYNNTAKVLLSFVISGGIGFYFTQNALLSQSIIVNVYCATIMCFILGQLNIIKVDQLILAGFILCCLSSIFYLPVDIETRLFGAGLSSILYFVSKSFFQKDNPEFDWNLFILMIGSSLFMGFSNVVFNLALFLILSVLIVLSYGIINKQENHKFNFIVAYSISIYLTMLTITKIHIKIPNPF